MYFGCNTVFNHTWKTEDSEIHTTRLKYIAYMGQTIACLTQHSSCDINKGYIQDRKYQK